MYQYVFGDDYKRFLQARHHANDITRAQRESASEIVSAIQDASRHWLLGNRPSRQSNQSNQQIMAVSSASDELAQLIVASHEKTGLRLSHRVDDVVAAVHDVKSVLQWELGAIQQTLGGVREDLREAIRSGKLQTKNAAYEQYEFALEAVEKGAFAYSLTSVRQAIHGDHTQTGYALEWRFHFHEGMVLLGSPGQEADLIDPVAAERAFLIAAKYARSESKRSAATALLAAARSCFVRGILAGADAHLQEARELAPEMPEVWYELAKVVFLRQFELGESEDRVNEMLSKAFDLDVAYCARFAADSDFARSPLFVEATRRSYRIALIDKVQRVIAPLHVEVREGLRKYPEIGRPSAMANWDTLIGGDRTESLGVVELHAVLDSAVSVLAAHRDACALADESRARNEREREEVRRRRLREVEGQLAQAQREKEALEEGLRVNTRLVSQTRADRLLAAATALAATPLAAAALWIAFRIISWLLSEWERGGEFIPAIIVGGPISLFAIAVGGVPTALTLQRYLAWAECGHTLGTLEDEAARIYARMERAKSRCSALEADRNTEG